MIKPTVFMVTENWWPSIGGLESSLYALAKSLSNHVSINIVIPSTKKEREMPNGIITTILPRWNFFENVISHVDLHEAKKKIIHLFGYSYFDIDGQERLLQYFSKLGVPIFLKVPTLGHTSKFSNEIYSNSVTCFIALTKQIAHELICNNIGCDKIFLIPNGVDIQRYKYAKYKNLSLTLGFSGRFTTQKKVSKLVSYFKDIASLYPIELHLVGVFDNTYGDVDKFEISSNVKLLPPMNELEKFYNTIDVYVSLSQAEGMPNSVLEAMASGKPLLLSDISGHQELVESNGWLVNNKKEFMKAIDIIYHEWVEDKLQLRGDLSRRIIEENYCIEVIGGKYFRKYMELLDL